MRSDGSSVGPGRVCVKMGGTRHGNKETACQDADRERPQKEETSLVSGTSRSSGLDDEAGFLEQVSHHGAMGSMGGSNI